jgi:hypothetical protein
MVVDHIGGQHSWLYAVTGGGRFFVSAAEVFVLIAGLTMGLVYRAIIAKSGLSSAVRKAISRSAKMYGMTVALTFAFAAVSALLALSWAPELAWRDVPRWAFEVVTLHRTYDIVNIPFMYTMLMLAAAPLLVLMARGWTWPILAASWAVWAGWQVAPGDFEIPWRVAENTMFHIVPWQLVFVLGLVAGFHWQTVQRWSAHVPATAAFLLSGTGMALAFVFWATQQRAGGLLQPGSPLAEQFFGKPDVRLARLVMLAVFFVFAYSATTLLWRPLSQVTGWLLLPFGQHSLTVYSLHLFVVAVLAWEWPTWTASRSAASNALIELLGVAIVWCGIVGWSAFMDRRAAARALDAATAPVSEARAPAAA